MSQKISTVVDLTLDVVKIISKCKKCFIFLWLDIANIYQGNNDVDNFFDFLVIW
jgi:hypothetical protein